MEPIGVLLNAHVNTNQSHPGIAFAQRLLNNQIQDEKEFIETCRSFYPEISLYKGEVLGSPESSNFKGTEGDKERMRTELSLLCLFWILKNDYNAFTECQQGAEKLKPETFTNLTQKVRGFLTTPELVHAMLVLMAIHDLGKCVWFSDAVRQKSNLVTSDHDVVLRDAFEYCPEILPSFVSLPIEHRLLIKDAWETGLNTGQFVQGECLPYHLVNALAMTKKNSECMNFFFCHELLDVAGVMGHEEPRGSKILNEQTLKNFQFAWNALVNPAHQKAEDIYRDYLWHRAPYFGFDDYQYQVAARRLICLSSFDGHKSEDFRTITRAFFTVDSKIIVDELNVTGLNNKKGILIYYSPHLLANLQKHYSKSDAIVRGIELLSRIYAQARKLSDNTPGNGSITVNVRPLCVSLLSNPELVTKSVEIDPITKMVTFLE